MPEKKPVSEIAGELASLSADELLAFIERYRKDPRAGAAALVRRAEKKLAAFEKEKARSEQMMHFERLYAEKGCRLICGIDEVGRGPLAGPVFACAVILPPGHDIYYLNDSKKLSAEKREVLCEEIEEKALALGLGSASHERIDEINILQATYEAMRMAIGRLPVKPDLLLVDAVTIPGISLAQHPIVHGDALSASIAAASIVAKVKRDRLMCELDREYPGYDFAGNKGYGTAAHIAALRRLGPCPVHRRSFIGHFLEKGQEG